MFTHILIPTDGSPLSNKAVKAGIKFAREIGARVTAYHALEDLLADAHLWRRLRDRSEDASGIRAKGA